MTDPVMVVAVLGRGDDGVVRSFGTGRYAGMDCPPDDVMMRQFGRTVAGYRNPKVVLDTGKTVWGCECWWGPAERVEKAFGPGPYALVDIDQVRREADEGVGP